MVGLEGIMLSQMSQKKKDKYPIISRVFGIQKTKQMTRYNKTEIES